MRNRWLSRRSLLAHLLVLIWVPGCAVAAWWQVTVALSGNSLAYLYSVEWPCFALFAIVVWWNQVHDDPDSVGARGLRREQRRASATTDRGLPADTRIESCEADDPDLAAYNAYLARLAEADGAARERHR